MPGGIGVAVVTCLHIERRERFRKSMKLTLHGNVVSD